MSGRFCLLLFVLVALFFPASAQKTIKGIIVDSATLNAIPNGTVKVKNTTLGTLTNSHGIFSIKVKPTDTLIFSSIGYNRLEMPVSYDDDVMFVALSQNIIMLREVSITENRDMEEPKLSFSKPGDKRTTPLSGLNASRHLGVKLNMNYFSNQEKEKRKLEELTTELSKTQTYVGIVTNPEVRKEMMDQFSISDSIFYKILTKFNEKHRELTHSSNPSDILTSLFSFFEAEVRQYRGR